MSDFLIYFIVAVAIIRLPAVCMLFYKAGVPAWKAAIPFCNVFNYYKIVWGRGRMWWFLLFPFGNIVLTIATRIKLARVYGRDILLGIGIMLFPTIFGYILAFEKKTKYIGPNDKGRFPILFSTAAVGIFGIILVAVILFMLFALGTFIFGL